MSKGGAWAPRVLAMACAALSVGCEVVPDAPALDAVVEVVDARDGDWAPGVVAELETGDEVLREVR